MYNLEILEEQLIKMNNEEIRNFLFTKTLIKRSMTCLGSCQTNMTLETCKNYTDNAAWRCYERDCSHYQKRRSIRDDSFFEKHGKNILKIIKIILRYAGGQTRHSILQTIDISKPTLIKFIDNSIMHMQRNNERNSPLGGPGCILQIDETMLNYKCMSQSGRSPLNQTDALVFAECTPNVNKIWAQVIPNKSAATLIPIILSHVIPGSTIHTDEHRSYTKLFEEGYNHSTVCHKYNFVNRENGTHTQNVESLNNCIKYEIKLRKGIKTYKRADFLTEFIWKWNNKNDLLNMIFELIKVQ